MTDQSKFSFSSMLVRINVVSSFESLNRLGFIDKQSPVSTLDIFCINFYGYLLFLVPEKYFGEFADYFCQAADKMEAAAEGSSQASG